MVNSSGTFSDGGDQESSKLNDSIRENTEKLGNLTKVLSSDSPTLKEMKSRANEVASSEVQATGRKFALQQQAQLDKLAANNFRATETIISELLSRFGGTSFYPALSAFRVARESVAVGTGKTQSELDVMDIIKFVNDSSKELLNNMFTSFGESIGLVKKPIDDLNASLQKTAENAQEAAKSIEPTPEMADRYGGKNYQAIKEQTMPVLSEYIKSLTKVSMSGVEGASTEELRQAYMLIQSSSETMKNFSDVLPKIIKEFEDIGEVVPTAKEVSNFQNIQKTEKENFAATKQGILEEVKGILSPQGEQVTPEAIKAARTAAGIAGLGVTALTLMTNFKQLGQVAMQTGTAMKNVAAAATLNPQGMTAGTAGLQPLSATAAGLPAIGSVIGTSIGTVLAGPAGGLIGGAIGSVIGSTVGLPIQAAVSILTAVEEGVSQIADSVVGFSPDVTMAMIERDIALLNDEMRRSNQIGDEIARITEAQTNLQLASRRAFDNIIEVVEPYLVTIINTLTILLNAAIGIKNGVEVAISIMPFGKDVLNFLRGINAGVGVLADLINPPDADIGDINSIINVRPDAAWFGRNNLVRPQMP
jgi:hypothetical protein